MEIFERLIKFFKRRYWLFLLVVVLISYGQLLWMQPWQDDNALFFKLANIQGAAGFLGRGPLGVGPYKYTATFYIPIYKLFEFNTVAYFAFALSFYFLATLSVYFSFSEILGKKAGKVAGFLYAAGYMASDGFIRLFNTIVTSLSVVLISCFTVFYWRFYKSNKYKWYALSVFFYFLAVEFARARTHYLMAVVLAFEAIFLAFKKLPSSLAKSAARVIPFGYIFYRYFVVNADVRSGKVKELILALMRGEFYQTYSWFSSLAHMIFPDWFMSPLLKQNVLRYFWFIAPLILVVIFYFLFKKKRGGKVVTLAFSLVTLVWLFIARNIFSGPVLNLNQQQLFIVFLGGVVIFLAASLYLLLTGERRKLYLFFFFWLFTNIGAYAAYQPTVSYESINRLLAHSFFALVGVLALLSPELQRKSKFTQKFVVGLILFWGLGNLTSSVVYQNNILRTRNLPAKSFYTQLKEHVPEVKKGDVFYFDVADSAEGYFADAFSVAQMPEETAIAWRYGVDRYDIKRVTKFEDLTRLIKEQDIPLENIYTFFYSRDGLIDTSGKTRQLLKNGSGKKVVLANIYKEQGEIVIELAEPIESVTPVEVELQISAKVANFAKLDFPYIQNAKLFVSKVAKDKDLRALAFEYQKAKNTLLAQLDMTASSDWQERTASNLLDGDINTVWQPDRLLWGKGEEASLVIDLKIIKEIDRFVWINAFGNNTPTEYSIELSLNGRDWEVTEAVSSLRRIDTKDPQVIEFESQKVRFIRMIIMETLNDDSPGISEVWVVSSRFSALSVKETEEFLKAPFGYVPDAESFRQTLSKLHYQGGVQVYWQSDKSETWLTESNSKISIIYDDIVRNYKLLLPAGGTKIAKIKLSDMEIPGTVILKNVTVRYPTLQEIRK